MLLWCFHDLTFPHRLDNCFVCSEHFGRTVAASQYFLQLAGYIGIPVISWNADNSGFERRVRIRRPLIPHYPTKFYVLYKCHNILTVKCGSVRRKNHLLKYLITGFYLHIYQIADGDIFSQSLKSQLRVQLAPSIEHQVSAMVAILVRWDQSVVRTQVLIIECIFQIQLEAVRGGDLRYCGPWWLCPSSQGGGVPHEGGSQHQVGHCSQPPPLLSTLKFWHHN